MPVLERERAAVKTVRPLSLCEFLAERGGIRLRYNERPTMGAGDLLAMNAERWHKARPFRKRLLRDDAGMNPDYAALTAWEAGYFPNSPMRPEINELLDLIDTDLASGSVYSAADRNEIQRLALLEDDAPEFDEPQETRDAPKGFPTPIHLRLIAPLVRYFPAHARLLEGEYGAVAYHYQFTTQRYQGRYISPWMCDVLGGEVTTKFWVRGFRHGETAPALLAQFDTELERAWYTDDFLHGPPF